MQRPGEIGKDSSSFSALSVGLALCLHGAIFAVMFLISAPLIEAQMPEAISIIMVPMEEEEDADIVSDSVDSPPAETISPQNSEPKQLPAPVAEPKQETLPEPQIDRPIEQLPINQSPLQPQNPIEILQSEEPVIAPGAGTPSQTHIPSRWALKPPLAKTRLEGLGFTQNDIECLTSLEDHCQDLRKRVFAEYRLTETELVWTPNRPDTGMPAEFRGLSEQEILEKLGMNYAGGNAFMLLPGITIDGPLWDKLHGVNKTCKLRQNYGNVLDGTAGTVAPRRVCD